MEGFIPAMAYHFLSRYSPAHQGLFALTTFPQLPAAFPQPISSIEAMMPLIRVINFSTTITIS